MLCTGARILLESLKREGVDLFFGYPGGAVIDIYDELSNHPDLRHILVRHEQGAVHAADGYARACGKVGVCLATSGPGATNTVTGIATAYSDSIPMVIFTGQVSTPLIGNDAFQEVDIIGITRPCTKHNFLVKDVKDLAETVRKAFYLARSGRPGPVLVDIPKNIQQASCEFIWPEDVVMRSYCPTFRANLNQLRRAMDVLVTSRKPLIVAGGGVIMANAAEELCTLAHLMHAPVCSTLMGLGAFPGDDPLWIGMLGMHGTFAANRAVTQADVILAVGARFDDRVTGKLSQFAPNARIVHIDIDPTTLRKNVRVEVPVVSDALSALQGLRSILESGHAQKDWAGDHADWMGQVLEWQKEHPLSWAKGDVLKPAAIGEAMSNHPIAQAIVQAYKGELPAAQSYQELGGYGISYELDGETVLLGNSRLMEHEKVAYEKANGIGTVVYVAKGGKFLGYILVADTLKENIADSLAALRKQGIQKMVMLTGDRRETAAAVAEELRLDEFHSELLPENKVEWMEKQKGAEGDKTAFVGDGINDAPVLAAADLGIAMGAIGSDAAIEAADVVLMDDDIGKLAVGMKVARNTRRIVNQNVTFALGFKILVLLLSIPGIATMWMAVFADVGVCVLAILNAMRRKA